MKALTVCQPWAWCITHHEKWIENRSWCTHYRGPLLIHAGKGKRFLDDSLPPYVHAIEEELVFGAIVGIAQLAAVVRHWDFRDEHGVVWKTVSDSSWASGPYCWVLHNRRRFLKPIPCKGARRFFEVPDRLVRQAIRTAVHSPASANAEVT